MDESRSLPAAAPARGTAATRWLDAPLVPLALATACALPLTLVDLPPLVDLPAHLATYQIMLAGDHGPLAASFGVHWQLVGNMGVEALMLALAPLVGLEPALRLIVIAIIAATAWSMLALTRAAHGHIPATALFALPIAYSYPFQYGFLNYSLAVAGAFAASAWWLRLPGPAGWRRGLAFAPVAALLWLCHVGGWVLFGVVAFGIELARRRDLPWGPRLAGSVTAVAPLALPGFAGLATAANGIAHWNPVHKLGWIVSLVRDRWMTADLLTAAAIFGIIGFALASRRVRATPLLATPALLCSALFLILPTNLAAGSGADMRVLPFATALAVLCFDVKPGEIHLDRWLALAGGSFCAIRLGLVGLSLVAGAAEQQTALGVLDALPRGASTVMLIARPCTRPWSPDRRAHLAGFATARKEAFSNTEWTIAETQLIAVRRAYVAPFADDPSQYVYAAPCPENDSPLYTSAIAAIDARGFNYVWTIGLPPLRRAGLVGMRQSGDSALYRLRR